MFSILIVTSALVYVPEGIDKDELLKLNDMKVSDM